MEKKVTIEEIIVKAADFFGIHHEHLTAKNREFDIVHARFITINYLIKTERFSLASIGRNLGGRTHAAIINARNRLKLMAERNPKVAQDINDLNKWMKSKC